MKSSLFLAPALFLLSIVSAGCASNPSAPTAAVECSGVSIKDLKPMIGHWHGKGEDGKEIEVVTRETSGGTAIEETLFPGTPHEMVSVYFGNDCGVQMTHYCMLGNQPLLSAKKISDKEFLFQFAGGTNLTPGKGQYMGEMRLTVVDEHHIREVWGSVKDGQKADGAAFDLWNCSGCKVKKSGKAKSK